MHSPHPGIFNSCCISGLWNEMCWLPLKQLHAGSQTAALLLWDALRMGFYSICASGGWEQSGWASVSPALSRGNCCFCGSAPNIEQRGKEKGGKSWQTEQGWAERRAARHTSRLAGCPPLPWLVPISLGCLPHFCKGILGPGWKAQEEAGRAASSPWAPQPGGSSHVVPWGKRTAWDDFTS